jgi:hydroxyacylglutathione hydrolase
MPGEVLQARASPSHGPEPVGDGVWRVTAGAFPSNAYICAAGPAGEGFVIDPGLDPQRIDAAAHDLGLTIGQVFCTHGHFDHIGGAHYFQQAYGAPVFMHPADLKTMKTGNFLLMVLKLDQRITLPEVTPVDPAGPALEVGGEPLVFHPLAGHTPGSCFIQHRGALFTGDSLYARGVGLSDLPGEDRALLRRNLAAAWERFPGETIIHPGHGPSARFEDIRTGNRALLAFLAEGGEKGR